MKDPAELNLKQFPDYSYIANQSDFTRENLMIKNQRSIPKNLNGNFSFGDRFFKNKLGVLISATIDNNSEGSVCNFINSIPNKNNSLDITSRNRKVIVTQSLNVGSNIELDYEINKYNRISLYN